MKVEHVSIAITGETYVSAIINRPASLNHNSSTGLVFAHGTANDMHHPTIEATAEGLARAGYITMRFNFPYRDKGLDTPNPKHELIHAWQKAMDFFKNDTPYGCDRIIAVGKSLGARSGSQAVAGKEIQPDGLLYLGYPLHQAGDEQERWDAHLYGIDIPMLFLQGTLDPYCNLDLLSGMLEDLNCDHELETIRDGNHSFTLPQSDARSQTDVHQQILTRCLAWLSTSDYWGQA